MGNIFDRQMSDVSIAMLESSMKKSTDKLSAELAETTQKVSNLIDLFYPVGSYYDTSDTSFDPNVTWGGIWELETEGLVHVGAGANYEAGSTGGETQHLLSSAESAMPSHIHALTNPTVVTGGSGTSGSGGSHYHSPSGSCSYFVVTDATTIARRQIHDGSTDHELFTQNLYANAPLERVTVTNSVEDHTHSIPSHTHTLSGGSIGGTEVAWASEYHNNMQPYIAVNRWHRTG